MDDFDLDKVSRLRRGLSRQDERKHGFELVALTLASLGFKWVAGVGGTPVYQVLEACSRHRLRVIDTHTQACAVLMAASSAWVAGRPVGAAILSAGPAITNAMTGILVAKDNGWPLLVLGGRRELKQGPGAFQALDAATLIAPIAKWTTCIEDASSIPLLIQEALRIACSGRPGPVYLDLPEDILMARAPFPKKIVPLPAKRTEAGSKDVEYIARKLISAKRPIIILGNSLRWTIDPERIRPRLLHSGLTTISLSHLRGVMPEESPEDIITAQQRAQLLSSADLVILLGCDLDWRLRFGAEIRSEIPIIAVSEGLSHLAARIRALERIEADPGAFLDQLLHRLSSFAILPEEKHSQTAFATHCRGTTNRGRGALTEEDCFAILQCHLPTNAFLVLDGNTTLKAGQRNISRSKPFAILDPGWNGCMGSGLPFALGAKIVQGSDPVVLCTGDFAFGFNIIELEASIRHGLPLIIFLFNNCGPNGKSYQFKSHVSPDVIHAYPSGLDYHKIAASLGMQSYQAADADQLNAVCHMVFADDSAAFVHLVISPTSSGNPSH